MSSEGEKLSSLCIHCISHQNHWHVYALWVVEMQFQSVLYSTKAPNKSKTDSKAASVSQKLSTTMCLYLEKGSNNVKFCMLLIHFWEPSIKQGKKPSKLSETTWKWQNIHSKQFFIARNKKHKTACTYIQNTNYRQTDAEHVVMFSVLNLHHLKGSYITVQQCHRGRVLPYLIGNSKGYKLPSSTE